MSTESVKRFELNRAVRCEPKYSRLKRYFREELDAGRLKPGQALPSEPRLAVDLQISRGTVRQALAELESEGMIYRVRGKGTYVRETPHLQQHAGLAIFALVIPGTGGGFYPSLLRGFEATAKQINHQVIVSCSENDLQQQENILLQLLDKKVAGVGLIPVTTPTTPSYQVQRLQKAGIPVVFCHRAVEGINAPLLALPYHKMGRMAGKAFVNHQHRRVAYLSTHRTVSTEASADGLREAMRDGGGDLIPEFTCYIGPSGTLIDRKAITRILEKLLQHPNPPTAIMANFDSLAEVVYLLLTEMGLRLPEDISLIGLDDTHHEGPIISELSSVTIDEAEVARRAVELLHDMQTGKRSIEDTERFLIPAKFVNARTLGENCIPREEVK